MEKHSETFDILEAAYFIKRVWDQVTTDTIKNGFSKASFQKPLSEIFGFDAGDNIPISSLSALIEILNENG